MTRRAVSVTPLHILVCEQLWSPGCMCLCGHPPFAPGQQLGLLSLFPPFSLTFLNIKGPP